MDASLQNVDSEKAHEAINEKVVNDDADTCVGEQTDVGNNVDEKQNPRMKYQFLKRSWCM